MHVSVHLLTMKISQSASENVCSYCKSHYGCSKNQNEQEVDIAEQKKPRPWGKRMIANNVNKTSGHNDQNFSLVWGFYNTTIFIYGARRL